MQFFCFFIGEQEIGIRIEHVLEISALDAFTVLPNAPKYIIGLVNLRGNIIPIVSLFKFFSLPGRDRLSKAVYINKDNISFGISVTGLSKTLTVADEDVSAYPHNVNQDIREFFSGIIHKNDRNIQILDIDRLAYAIKKKERS